ncbi:cathelicidin antimicrobial peptide [Perognathus longimembris pacificus]|uniref:cathelicidin antimicrobial peptide n=1 Tax=Perognathus longimembris pacificus TaxID=214514 RepID=UPI00201901E6|nr:cathelicidin antimicrobial peptide [Perognathus longimembris pacificus]
MGAHRASSCLGQWLLLLFLLMPPAFAQTLSYREAALRAVDSFNQKSSEANLYRLLALDFQPQGEEEEEEPGRPRPLSFSVMETVCAKASPRPLVLCDFKENGLVKRCEASVTPGRDAQDVDCNSVTPPFKKASLLGGLIKKGGKKIGEKIEKIGQKINEKLEKIGQKISGFFNLFRHQGEP